MVNGKHFSPIDAILFDSIQSRQPITAATAQQYLDELEMYVQDDRNKNRPDYSLARAQILDVQNYLNEVDPTGQRRYESQVMLLDSAFSASIDPPSTPPQTRRSPDPEVTPPELEAEITQLVEDNPSESQLHLLIPYIARRSNRSSNDIWRLFYAKRDELEQQGMDSELRQELDSLLSISSATIDLADFLPAQLATPITRLANRMSLRPAVCLTTLLTGVSSCHQVGTSVLLEEEQDFEVPGNIFAGIVSPSGQKKSPIFKTFLFKPLGTLQRETAREHIRQLEEYELKKEQYRSCPKEDRDDRFPEGAPEPPGRMKLHYFTDGTVVGINRQFEAHPSKGLLYLRDELAGLFASYNKFSGGKGSDRQDILTFFDATGHTEVRSEGVESNVEKSLLSIFGTIQPDVLRQLMGEHDDADGHWARFLFVSQPLQPAQLMPTGAKFEITGLLVHLYRSVGSIPETQYRLSKEAFEYYQPIYNRLEILRCKSEPGMSAVYAKQEGYIGRLALNLHIIDEVLESDRQYPLQEISLEAMQKACKLAAFFIDQIKLLHANAKVGQGEMAPNLAAVLVRSRELGWIKARDIQQKERQFKNTIAADIRRWFKQLETLGYGECRGQGNRMEFKAKT